MRKILISLLVLVCGAWIPSQASAAITWSMSDGTTTKTSTTSAQGKFAPLLISPFGQNGTLFLLTGCTAPCSVGFPSGATPPSTGDTYTIADISSTNRARIEKIDVPSGGTATSGPDSVTLRGVKIFARTATARTFTLSYSTATGDLSTITSSTGNYIFAAKIKGQFRTDTTSPIDGLSGSIPTTCDATNLGNPCVRLSVQVNGLTVAGQDPIVTTSIPCSTTTSATSYCGSGGSYNPGLIAGDQFLSSDSETVGCGTTCAPRWVSTLTVRTNAINQVLTLSNSVGTGLVPATPDDVIDLAAALGEPGIDFWVWYCGQKSGVQPYRVTGLPPFGNPGRTRSANATFPMKFTLEKGQVLPATGGIPRFLSIDDPAEVALPPAEQLANDACSVSWVPSPSTRPKFSQISQLNLNFTDFVGGTADSGNPLLGDLLFSACEACFRVEIQLVNDSGVSQGTLVVYTGAEAGNFYRHNDVSTSPLVLVSDPGLRVDAQAMNDPNSCCITFAAAQGNNNYGKLLVKSITAWMDPGLDTSLNPLANTGNHLVRDLEVIVQRSTSTPSSSNGSMLTVGNFQPSCAWPALDGLKIYIYRVDSDEQRVFVQNVLNPTIDFSLTTCPLTASVSVGNTDIYLAGTYEATVTANSAADGEFAEFIGGIGLPNPGVMILK
jgi:hypothetical protein